MKHGAPCRSLVFPLLGLILLAAGSAASPGSASPREAEARRLLSRAQELQRKGDPDSARIISERALGLALRSRPPIPALECEIRIRAAHILYDLGDFKSARSQAEAALDGADLQGSRVDSLLVAAAEGAVGKALLRGQDGGEARSHLLRAIGIRERIQGPEHIDLVAPLQQMATWHGLRGDFETGNALLDRAIAIVEKSDEDDPALIGSLYSQASSFRSRGGGYVEAVQFGRTALAAREKLYGPMHKLTVQSLLALGAAEGHLGNYVGATDHIEKAVGILRQTVSPGSEDLAYGLSTLGSAYLVRREWRRARAVLEEATAIRRKLYGPEDRSVIYLRSCVADALVYLGELDEAARTYQEVAAIQALQDPQNYVATLSSMALLELKRGRPQESLALLDRQATLCDTLVGTDNDHSRGGRRLRLDVLERQGRRREALDGALALEREEREGLLLTAASLSEREATAALAIRVNGLDKALSLIAEWPGISRTDLSRVFDEMIRSRALVFEVQAERRRRLRESGAEFPALTAAVDSARIALATQRLAAHSARSAPAVRARVDSLQAAVDEAERALGQRSANFLGGMKRIRVGFAEVARALPARGCLVSFARYRAGGEADASREEHYVALIASAAGERINVVSLGPADALDTLIETWRGLAGSPPGSDARERSSAERACANAGFTIRRAIWDRLEPHLRGASTVFLVPDGALLHLNFAALPDGRGRFLAEVGPLVATLTTERDLLLPRPKPTGRGLLIVGGPDFDDAPSRPTEMAGPSIAARSASSTPTIGDRTRFSPLYGAVSEGRQLADLWRQALPRADVRLLSGGAASESAFKSYAENRRALHLATHGILLTAGSSLRLSAVSKAPVRGVTGVVPASAGAQRTLPGTPPLSECGLAMAGANRTAANSSDDGYLTGAEISALELGGTEWAVLSACRTGVAALDQPESVQGLHRAFRLAGAQTVIMSLWPVEDESTRAWMLALYRSRFRDGATTPAAVRSAQRAVLDARRRRGETTHPFYWAPFVAMGSPR